MPFEQAAALLPLWVQYWINFIVLVPAISVVIFLFNSQTRRDALIVFLLVGAGMAGTLLLYMQFGMVRLLGLGHVIFWTAAAVYLWRRLRTNPPPKLFKVVMWVLLATLVAALVFDYLDVIRWILGERASII